MDDGLGVGDELPHEVCIANIARDELGSPEVHRHAFLAMYLLRERVERAYIVASRYKSATQMGADEACSPGYEDLHPATAS
jgi:hypothetical protein